MISRASGNSDNTTDDKVCFVLSNSTVLRKTKIMENENAVCMGERSKFPKS